LEVGFLLSNTHTHTCHECAHDHQGRKCDVHTHTYTHTCHECAHDHQWRKRDVQPRAEAAREDAGQAIDGEQVDDKGVTSPAHHHVQVTQDQASSPCQGPCVQRLQAHACKERRMLWVCVPSKHALRFISVTHRPVAHARDPVFSVCKHMRARSGVRSGSSS